MAKHSAWNRIVRKGVIWRIGDGNNIEIWRDPWLPRDNNRRPITPRRQVLLRYVSELINPITGEWDKELVHDVFWEEDAKIILALTVHQGRDNMLAWHFDSKGNFSVRSAYKVCRDDLIRHSGSQIGSSSDSTVLVETKMWSQIWNLRAPGKIKHFLWRMAHNSHALRMNLQQKKMELNTKCLLCQRVDEDGGHLYFKCKQVKKLWRCLNMEEERVKLADISSAVGALEFILAAPEEKLTIVVAMWTWWIERNRVREGERARMPEQIAHNIIVYVAELQKVFVKEKGNVATNPIQKWSKPTPGYLKINCDASFNPITKDGGWGFIIRDSDGDIVSAGRGRVDALLSALQAEAIACLHGVQKATDLGIGRAILETDAALICQAIAAQSADLSLAGHFLIHELKDAVMNNFISLQVNYVLRCCNKVAHELTVLGCRCSEGDDPILDVLPTCIMSLVSNDLGTG